MPDHGPETIARRSSACWTTGDLTTATSRWSTSVRPATSCAGSTLEPCESWPQQPYRGKSPAASAGQRVHLPFHARGLVSRRWKMCAIHCSRTGKRSTGSFWYGCVVVNRGCSRLGQVDNRKHRSCALSLTPGGRSLSIVSQTLISSVVGRRSSVVVRRYIARTPSSNDRRSPSAWISQSGVTQV